MMGPFYKNIFVAILLSSVAPNAIGAPTNDWQLLILQGRNAEEARNYADSIRTFSKALTLAETRNLAPKCVPISLCRQIRSELLSGQIARAEPLFNRVVNLAEKQKRDKTFDPEVGIWMADVADTYLAKKTGAYSALCIKHSNTLKMLAIDVTKKEYADSLISLARLYVESGQIDEGVRIFARVESINSSNTGKNQLPYTLYQEAIRCKILRKFDYAERLELIAMKRSSAGSQVSLSAAIPAHYCLISMCSLAEGKDEQANHWSAMAIKEVKRITPLHDKQLAKSYLSTLMPCVKSDEMHNQLRLAESEYKLLVKVQEALFPDDPRQLYGTMALLTDTLANEHKYPEWERQLKKTVAIALLPQSCVEKDLPDLYMRLGMAQAFQNKIDLAGGTFTRALELDGSNNQFHSSLTLLWWGFLLSGKKSYSQAEDKLTQSLNIARALPPQRRGTVAADALQILSIIRLQSGKKKEAQSLVEQSIAEIKLQKEIHSKLGPDIYHRVGS
jgi:tetratricopeptide (TPR) repeat protein